MQLAEQNQYLGRLLVKVGKLSAQQVSVALDTTPDAAPLAKLLLDSKQIRPETAQDITHHQMRLAEGEILLSLGAITTEQLEAAMLAAEGNQALAIVLIKQNVLKAGDVRDLAHRYAAKPVDDIIHDQFDPVFLDLVPKAIAQRYQMLALARLGDRLVVATPKPNDINALDDVRILTGYKPVPVEIDEGEFEALWEGARRKPLRPSAAGAAASAAEFDVEVAKENAIEDLAATDVEEAPVILLVDEILGNAIATGVSDIHIEPKDR